MRGASTGRDISLRAGPLAFSWRAGRVHSAARERHSAVLSIDSYCRQTGGLQGGRSGVAVGLLHGARVDRGKPQRCAVHALVLQADGGITVGLQWGCYGGHRAARERHSAVLLADSYCRQRGGGVQWGCRGLVAGLLCVA